MQWRVIASGALGLDEKPFTRDMVILVGGNRQVEQPLRPAHLDGPAGLLYRRDHHGVHGREEEQFPPVFAPARACPSCGCSCECARDRHPPNAPDEARWQQGNAREEMPEILDPFLVISGVEVPLDLRPTMV